MKTVHVFTVVTGAYHAYLVNFVESLKNIKNFKIFLHVFSNNIKQCNDLIQNINHKIYKIPNMPYPFVALFKFNTIIELIENNINDDELCLFADIDTKFIDNIPDDINKYDLCFCRSSWISGNCVKNYLFSENNLNLNVLKSESDCEISFSNETDWYAQSSLIMGKYKYFVELNNYTMDVLSKITNKFGDPYSCNTQRYVKKIPKMQEQTLVNLYIRYNIKSKNIVSKCYSCNIYNDDISQYKIFKSYYDECFMYQKYDSNLKLQKRNVKFYNQNV